jgi:hypothetical protein
MTSSRQVDSPNTTATPALGGGPGQAPYTTGRASRAALIGAALAWLVLLALIARHRVFVTHDSLISYAHSWWIDRQLWHGHGIPWRMPILGHGQALTFPYGMLPWTAAGVLWPLAGEYAVTGVLVAGAAGLIAAIFWAFPEARQPWWAVLVLVNPPLIAAALSGQVPFMWACALLATGIGCWRRGHRRWAVVLVGLAQLCHPAVVLPIAFVIVLLRLKWEPDRRRLAISYLLSLCLAIPGIVAVLQSPVFAESSLHTKLAQFVGTVLVRGLVLLPGFAAAWPLHTRRGVLPALAAVLLSLNVMLLGPLDAGYAWGSLTRKPDPTLLRFTATPEFRPGAMYRVVGGLDGKVGMYQLIRHGARLDSEFFPESIWFGNFGSTRAYSDFLVRRHVDYVLIFANAKKHHATNEGALLPAMAASGDRCTSTVVGVRLVAHHPGWDDYAIDRGCRTGGGIAW